jgi:hypothetical protein
MGRNNKTAKGPHPLSILQKKKSLKPVPLVGQKRRRPRSGKRSKELSELKKRAKSELNEIE